MTPSHSRTCTVKLRKQDTRFFKRGTVLPHATLLEDLQKSDDVRLYLNNQKNGKQHSTMYHDAINHTFYPVKSIANHTHYLYSIAPVDASLPISYVGKTQHVTTTDIKLEFW